MRFISNPLTTLALACTASVAMSLPSKGAVIFSESFDDGNAASRWSAPIVDSETGVLDGSVDYAFDYGTAGIAPAPGSTTTIGVRFLVNPTDDTSGDEGESIGIIAENFTLPDTDYAFKMDVYAFDDLTAGGSTEYITMGVHTAAVNSPASSGLDGDVPLRFGLSDGNGLSYQSVADDGSSSGFFRFEDAGNANTGSETSFGPTGNDFRNRWVTLEIVSLAGLVTYTVDGNLVDSFDNSASTFAQGSVLIGLADAFNSAAGESVFTVIDNVHIDDLQTTAVPEPSTAGLVLVGFAVAATCRRRSRLQPGGGC